MGERGAPSAAFAVNVSAPRIMHRGALRITKRFGVLGMGLKHRGSGRVVQAVHSIDALPVTVSTGRN